MGKKVLDAESGRPLHVLTGKEYVHILCEVDGFAKDVAVLSCEDARIIADELVKKAGWKESDKTAFLTDLPNTPIKTTTTDCPQTEAEWIEYQLRKCEEAKVRIAREEKRYLAMRERRVSTFDARIVEPAADVPCLTPAGSAFSRIVANVKDEDWEAFLATVEVNKATSSLILPVEPYDFGGQVVELDAKPKGREFI